MLRKICSIGNSRGVSLPKEMLDKFHLTVGSQVEINMDLKANKITIEPANHKPESIDKEFASQVKGFIKRYKPALKALAD